MSNEKSEIEMPNEASKVKYLPNKWVNNAYRYRLLAFTNITKDNIKFYSKYFLGHFFRLDKNRRMNRASIPIIIEM